MKLNDDECKGYEKSSKNNRQSKHEYEKECDEIDEQIEGVFVNSKLITADENCNFQ